MPFVTIYLKRGYDEAAMVKSMKEISETGADLLENTLLRMVRVTVLDAPEERVYIGGEYSEGLHPTVIFNVGPGRSPEAKQAFMRRIAEILSKNLGCEKEDVREYILDESDPNNFVIGGVVKDFNLKVK